MGISGWSKNTLKKKTKDAVLRNIWKTPHKLRWKRKFKTEDEVRTGTSSAFETKLSLVVDGNIISVGSNIGISTTDTVIDTTVCAETGVSFVVRIWGVMICEESGK